MSRAYWVQAEKEFSRRAAPHDEDDMGAGRWSRWGRGPCEGHTLEFGFRYRFDISPGPRSNGHHPDFWSAHFRSETLGEFPTFEEAARACEDKARLHIEAAVATGETSGDMVLVIDHWKQYLELPHRFRSRKSSSRRR